MKTSNILLAGAFVVVVIITIVANIMLKNELKNLKEAPNNIENENISFNNGTISIQTTRLSTNTSSDIKDFKIVVEKMEDGIKLQSVEGSAWIELTFNLENNKPQAIDEYGMTELDKVSSKKDANLADFLFTITKKGNIISLEGIEGTVWTHLKFTLNENEKQAIDQFGMTDL